MKLKLLAAIAALALAAPASDLSREYTFVEYVKATGSQRMNLAYWNTPTTRVETVCIFPKSGQTYYSAFFGSRNSSWRNDAFLFSGSFSGGKVMWNLTGKETFSSTSDYFYDQKITLTLDAATKACTWTNESGQSAGFSSVGEATDGVCSWGLFEDNNATTHDGVSWGDNRSCATVYSFKIWDGETLRCDLRPAVRSSDGHVGLYDACRKTFIENLLETPLVSGDPVLGLSVAAIEDQVVDGVNPCAPTLSVTDADGILLSEGVDYDVVWPDLAAPGAATVSVYGKDGTASEGLYGSATFNIQLSASPKKRPYLPAGYVEMDGVSGTGSQYLTTGRKSKADTRVECELTSPSHLKQYSAAFGHRTDWRSNAFVFYVSFAGDQVGYNRSGVEDKGDKFTFGERTLVVADGLTATWTSASASRSITATGKLTDADYDMYVFTDNSKGWADSTTTMTLHSFRMVEDDVTVCWLVPCYRESDGAVGAFDVALRQSGDAAFRQNIGSGEFQKGTTLYRPTSADVSLDFYLERADSSEISYGWSVNDEEYAGGTLKAAYSTSSDLSSPVEVDLGTAEAYANKSASVDGLDPETTLYFRLTLSKDGKDDVVREFSATTASSAGRLGGGVSMNWSRPSNPEFTCTVATLGAGDVHRVKLYLGADADALELAATQDVEAAGLVTVSAAWPTYYVPVYYKIVYENGTGDQLYSCETESDSYTPTYTAAYTWNSKVTEGAWSDAGNWTITTCNVANPSESWPQREAYHAAVVPDCWTGVVVVAGGEECLYVRAGQNSRATLRGPADGDPAAITVGGLVFGGRAGAQIFLDRVHFTWTDISGSRWSGSDHVGNYGGIRLDNGSSIDMPNGGWPIVFGNSVNTFLEVCGGSRLTFAKNNNYFFMKGPGSRVLVDDSEFSCNVPVYLNDAADGSVSWTFSGASPRVVAAGGLKLPGAGGATLEFSPAKGGWEQSALSVTKGVCLDGAAGVATVAVADDAPVWKSMKKVDFALIDSAGGINTNAFKIVAPRRSNGELYWYPSDVESPTQLRFRMSPPGMLLIIR